MVMRTGMRLSFGRAVMMAMMAGGRFIFLTPGSMSALRVIVRCLTSGFIFGLLG
jgi:hypothetical protein